jgi:Skp family chaperone for outer membrane proteins
MMHRQRIVLSAAVLFGIGAGAGFGLTQRPSAQARDGVQPPPARSGYVNMAVVLKGFKKGNAVVQELQNLRNHYIEEVNKKRTVISLTQKAMEKLQPSPERDKLEDSITKLQREIQDIDKKAQKELGALSNETLVEVYKEVTGVVADVAKDNGLDVIHSYLAATTEAEKESASVAQLVLQSPAMTPLYLAKHLDFTDEILKRLNEKHPPKEG